VYYTDGCIYRLKRRTTETAGVLHNQLRDQGAKEWVSTATPSTGCTNIVILHSYEKWHCVQYAARCLRLLKVKRWYDFSGPRDTDVKWEKKSAHHATPILESMSYGHSSHPKLKSTHNDCNTVLLLYFLFLFPPFSASGTPRSLPHINGRKSNLPNCQQELSASPQRLGMWPSVFLSHSFNDTNDGTLSHTFNLAFYGLWTVKTRIKHFCFY
jgi:hypothetical protein